MPEALISGDSSNANLASALVAEGPFVRAMSFRQWHYRNQYKRILERVLEFAATTGMLGAARDTILDTIEISVETPPVIARKANEETQRNEVLAKNHILSPQSWSAREDLDRGEELANMAEDPPFEPAAAFGDEGDGEEGSNETKTETGMEKVT